MNNNDIADRFSCPVCLEIPPDKIFQCCNGHTVCRACFENLSSCPECRAEYENLKIRNLALETILNAKKFSCPNKPLGCKENLSRNELAGHQLRCDFSEATVPLCQILGLHCAYKTCTKNTTDALRHFTSVHNSAWFDIGQAVKIRLEDFGRTDFGKSSVWTPLIFLNRQDFHMKGTCMLFAKVNGEDKTLSLICVMLGARRQECNIQAIFAINNDKKSKIPVEWSTSGVTLYDAEQAIKRSLLRIPEKILKEDYMNADGCLEMLAVFKRKPEGVCTLAGTCITGTVHLSNQPEYGNDVPRLHFRTNYNAQGTASRFQQPVNRVMLPPCFSRPSPRSLYPPPT